MATVLPPPPIGEPPGSFAWQQWYLALQQIYAGTGTVPWELIDTSGSDITDIVSRAHNNLQSMQGGTAGEFFHLTSAQHTILNNGLASGTYTPTLTNVTNLDGSTAYEAQYIRIGNTVTVSGKVDVDATAGAATELGISLPIASNFGAEEDCAGVGAMKAVQESTAIVADATNNRASMQWLAVSTSSQTISFTFTFQVI